MTIHICLEGNIYFTKCSIYHIDNIITSKSYFATQKMVHVSFITYKSLNSYVVKRVKLTLDKNSKNTNLANGSLYRINCPSSQMCFVVTNIKINNHYKGRPILVGWILDNGPNGPKKMEQPCFYLNIDIMVKVNQLRI